MSKVFSFPPTVNEKAVRVVAGTVMLASIVGLATSSYWLFLPLAYGFAARVLAGPTLSPLARLASSVIAPRLGPSKQVLGPPKRFAQGLGAVMTIAGAALAFGAGLHGVGDALFGAMILAAGLESIFAVCLGCRLFALLMRIGLVPVALCPECADIWARPGMTAPPA